MRLIILVPVMTAALVAACARHEPPKDIEKRLLTSFETVVSAAPQILQPSDMQEPRPADLLNSPFYFLRMALTALDPQLRYQVSRSAERIIVGARDFRAPNGPEGAVQSTYCYVVVLREGSSLQLPSNAASTRSAGRTILEWSAFSGEGGYANPLNNSVYAVRLNSRLLLVTNRKEELSAIAELLTNNSSEPNLALPSRRALDETWLWAYRKYRHTTANRVPAGLRDISPGTEALIFAVDGSRQAGTLEIIGSDVEPTATALNSHHVLPPLVTAEPGRWRTTIPLMSDPRVTDQVAKVMALLGFGAYV